MNDGSRSPAEALATWVHGLSLDDIPGPMLLRYKAHLLDALVCAGAAWRVPGGRVPVSAMARLGGGPDATLLLGGVRVPAANAAFANAQMSIALDLGANLYFSQGLPGITVFSALALAEKMERSGRDLIEAIVAGFEVAARVALSQPPRRRIAAGGEIQVAARPDVAWIGLGAGGSTAKIARLSPEQGANGLALVAASSPVQRRPDELGRAGVHGQAGGGAPMAKSGLVGLMASAGILCSSLAADGFTGDVTILDSPRPGSQDPAQSGLPWDGLIDSLGQEWLIADANFKRVPAGTHNQSAIHAFKQLIEAERIQADEIESVQVTRALGLSPGFANVAPQNYVDAEFSLPSSLAAAALRLPEQTWIGSYADPRMRTLAGRVSLAEDPASSEAYRQTAGTRAFRDPWWLPSTVIVKTRRGVFTRVSRYGDVSWDEVVEKARRQLDGIVEPRAIDRLVEMVLHVEELDAADGLGGALGLPTGIEIGTA